MKTLPAKQVTDVAPLLNTRSLLQRQCAGCGNHTVAGGGCSDCEKKKSLLQRRALGSESENEMPPIVGEVLHSPGQPLDTATRAFMEPRFHHDFSRVRVHTDAKAAESARAVNATAYTVGPQIVFDTGQYVPGTVSGKNLLAHELTHVLQQSAGLARSPTPIIGPANDEHEQQADAVAHAIVNVPGKSFSSRSWAHKAPFHQVSVGSGLPPVSRARLQRKTNEDELFGDSFSSEATGGASDSDKSDTKSACPKVPTKRGDDIPAPACPTATHTGTTELRRFNFCLDSDELTNPGQLNEVNATVNSVHQATRFLIHGYASPEGKKDYNFRLACHRAIKIANAFRASVRALLRASNPKLTPEMLDAEVNSRVETAAQGPTVEFGAAESNRIAVVYGQIPGRDEPEPGCDKAPRKIGDIKPENNCDAPTKDLAHMNGSPQLTHFHFCLDSDVLAATNSTNIRSFAHRQAASSVFFVHGFSSVEGAADYNQRLSCHRALRLARELMNAGVNPQQVKEVSGLGETNRFGDDPEFNRVAIVFAEGGKISDMPGGKRQAATREGKEAVRDEALQRISSGQYNLGADAYISFWTCGRTATVRQAVERLSIEVKDTKDNKEENVREEANGTEEGFGVNFVRLSNVTLRADNAIECTMGRLVDMAFHHAVVDAPDLDEDLTKSFNPRADLKDPARDPKNKEARHQAGLHLIHLAGLSACAGEKAQARKRGQNLGGIDEPLAEDPRADIPPPGCAQAPQPTRLHPPAAGAKERQTVDFQVFDKKYTLTRGTLKTPSLDESKTAEEKQTSAHSSTTAQNVINAKADVSVLGPPDVFADYEIGFIQTILDDMTLAEYTTGHRALQKLPVPIRAAQLKGDARVPEPWMAMDAMQRPDAEGQVHLKSGWRLNTDYALTLRFFRPGLEAPLLDTWQRHTSVALWLIARRLGAPLDRFSVVFLDGVVYDITQDFNVGALRRRGDMALDENTSDIQGKAEKELFDFVGNFRTSETSSTQADSRTAQFHDPTSSDIDLNRQTSRFLEPEAAPVAGGMSIEEYKQVAQQILDELVILAENKETQKLERTEMPRLGFDFSPLTIHVDINRSSGRMIPFIKTLEKSPVRIESKDLGKRVLHHLQKALHLRLSKRDFLKQGRAVILSRDAVSNLPGTKEVGTLKWTMPPLKPEPLLTSDSKVLDDMAEAWACTLLTKSGRFVRFGAREFGRSYAMDRDRGLHPEPPDRLVMGNEDLGEGFKTDLPCPRPSVGVTMGGFHTHPEIQPTPVPTDSGDEKKDDLDFARECGSQAYIVTDFKAFRYFGDGSVDPNPTTLPKKTTCDGKHLEELKIVDGD